MDNPEQTSYAYFIFSLLISHEYGIVLVGKTDEEVAVNALYEVKDRAEGEGEWPDFRPAIANAMIAVRHRYPDQQFFQENADASEALMETVVHAYRVSLTEV